MLRSQRSSLSAPRATIFNPTGKLPNHKKARGSSVPAIRPEALAEGIDVVVDGQEITITLPGAETELVRLGNR